LETIITKLHCLHFGTCGGCAVDDRAAIDKYEALAIALAKAGYVFPPIAPLISTPLHTRRRADLAASRNGATIALGLHKSRSAEVVDMQECTLLIPEITALLPSLKTLLKHLETFRRTGAVIINWLDHGADILLRTDAQVTGPDRTKLIAFARAHNLLRISVAEGTNPPELIAMLAPPTLTLSGIPVEPPPGAFLQASRDGEAAIIAAIIAGLPKLTAKSKITELYAGIGTLSFALAQHARVEAYEGNAEAVAAHGKAIRTNNLAGRMSVALRDLTRRPVLATEFQNAAAVVLDPPFAGAAVQIKFLTQSNVRRIIYVSCNPDALAQDAAALRRAGYSVIAATPIDQFPYSENVESVVVFDKGRISTVR
jgi:23S rRNA (uracil1939-C5)-methyltransferase